LRAGLGTLLPAAQGNGSDSRSVKLPFHASYAVTMREGAQQSWGVCRSRRLGGNAAKKAEWRVVRRPTVRSVGTECRLNERLYIFGGENFLYCAGAT
jgi:hypothetical protein